MVRWLGGGVAVGLVVGSTAAWADEPPTVAKAETPASTPVQVGVEPSVHHAPLTTAKPHQDLAVDAEVVHPHLVRSLRVVYQTGKAADVKTSPFQRAGMKGYVAVIPAKDVKAPGLAYTIEMEKTDGGRVAVFASRDEMQPVGVSEDFMDVRERLLFERLGGRRSVASVTTELVHFGRTSGDRAIPCAEKGEGCTPGTSKVPTDIADRYWRVEAAYTYRPLRTVAEFSIRGGVVRGRSLVALDEYDESKYDVGLNYGSPQVRFRLADVWHLEAELLTSVTEVGFSVGTGGALLIGDPYGSKLTLGFQTIGLAENTYFGSRFYTRMDIMATERFSVAPIVEITDMPHAETFGVRLLAETAVAMGGGFALALRGGYQARKSTSGGLGLGANASLAF